MMFRKRFTSLVSIFALLLTLSAASGCFSLGTADMPEYTSRFPEVRIAPWGLNATKVIPMSAMLGDEDSTADDDISQLTRQVDDDTYRMFWVNVADGDGNYPTSSVSEVAFYLACTGGEGQTVNFKIFKSAIVPTVEVFNLANILNSENNALYQDGQIIDNLPDNITVLATGSATLKKEWTDIYAKLNTTVTLSPGERLVIYIAENNDSKVSVIRKQGVGTTTTVTAFPAMKPNSSEQQTDTKGNLLYYNELYEYRFARYPDNDISFSIDKVLLHVKE